MAIAHFVYPFSCLGTFGLFPVLHYYKSKLLGTFVYKAFCGYLFSFLLDEALEVELRTPRV